MNEEGCAGLDPVRALIALIHDAGVRIRHVALQALVTGRGKFTLSTMIHFHFMTRKTGEKRAK